MNTPDTLRAASERTEPPVISEFMQSAGQSGLISLAAGFVDQRSRPHEITELRGGEILGATRSRASPAVRKTVGGTHAPSRVRRAPRAERGGWRGDVSRSWNRRVVIRKVGRSVDSTWWPRRLLDPGDSPGRRPPHYFVSGDAGRTRGSGRFGDRDRRGGDEARLAGGPLAAVGRGELDRSSSALHGLGAIEPSGISGGGPPGAAGRTGPASGRGGIGYTSRGTPPIGPRYEVPSLEHLAAMDPEGKGEGHPGPGTFSKT